jgi:hypothetical protein
MSRTIDDKECEAILLVEVQAIAELFGEKAASQAAILDKEAFEEWLNQLLAITAQATNLTNEQVTAAFQNAVSSIGRHVPYVEEWYSYFVSMVAKCGLPFVTGELARHIQLYELNYPQIFNAVDGGYKLMLDLLIDARYRKEDGAGNNPSVDRAIHWLEQQLQSSATLVASSTSQRTTPKSFYDLLSGGFIQSQLDQLIGKDGLNLFDFATQTATVTQKPADWVTVYWVLKNKGFISAGTAASLAQHLIKSTFPGTRISTTRLNSDNPGEHPSKGNTYYYHVISLL